MSQTNARDTTAEEKQTDGAPGPDLADDPSKLRSRPRDTRTHPGEFVTFRLMRTVEGLSLFFVFFMLLVFLLYVIGNTQHFLESSQHMLLQLLEVSALLCSFASAYYLLLLSAWMIRRRFLVLPRIVYSIVAVALGLMFAYGSSFLTVLFTSAG